ncbi:MAG: M20/M25/M40 family metallo-hydrolase [Flavobacteriales bacterium]|nr:M20/M25/M40 family metallo-hydrolase [Flavobacteriales bacterium]
MTKAEINLLKKICEVPGAPGFEQKVREVVLREVKGHVDEVSIDNMGNVSAIIRGSEKTKKGERRKRAMIGAHMDEIGFIVSHIGEDGFLRFHTLGGFDPKTLTAQRVIVHGKKDMIGVMGAKPIHVMTSDERNKAPKITDYWIDMGMPKKEVEKYISVGDPITRDRALIEMGNCVNCKSIDNRVSVYILIQTLKAIKKPKYDIYGVFTVQEEIGLRGAEVAALEVQPDFGFGLDTTIAYDVPGASPHEKITEVGKGTAIKIMDARTVCDYRMVEFMKKTAKKHKIKWQPELLPAGGTDTAPIQRNVSGGSIAGAVSIPTRHIHTVIEMASKSDIDASTKLLTRCLEELHTYNWDFK